MCESAFGVGEQLAWLIKHGEIVCRKNWSKQLARWVICIYKAREPHFTAYELGFVDRGAIWEAQSCFVDCLLRELWGESQSFDEKLCGFYRGGYKMLFTDKGHIGYAIALFAYFSPSSNAFLFSSTTFAGTFAIIVSYTRSLSTHFVKVIVTPSATTD